MLRPSTTVLSSQISQQLLPLWSILHKLGIVYLHDASSIAPSSATNVMPSSDRPKSPGRSRSRSRKNSKSLKEANQQVIMNNLTILNFLLHHLGPMTERQLTYVMMAVQALSCVIGFVIRYKVVHLVY